MAPISCEGRKNAPISCEGRKNKFKGVKGLIKSLLGMKKKCNNEDNVCDALPGPPPETCPRPSGYENNARDDHLTANNNTRPGDADSSSQRRSKENNDNEHTHNVEEQSDEETKPKIEEPLSDEDNPNPRQEGNKKREFPHNYKGFGGIPGVYQNNIHITGENIHIGPETNVTYYMNDLNQKEKKPEKSEAVRALLKSKEQVEPCHIDCLAGVFGKQWRMIGLKLLFTDGDLTRLKSQSNDRKEVSYYMLNEWANKRSTTTIGQLCIALWDTKLENAIKAVNELSVMIGIM